MARVTTTRVAKMQMYNFMAQAEINILVRKDIILKNYFGLKQKVNRNEIGFELA